MGVYELVTTQDAGANAAISSKNQREARGESWCSLVWTISKLAVPTAVGNAFEYLPVCFALMIVGHLEDGRDNLDSLSLGRAWFNFTALAPGFGLLAGLRTLCPQAVGANRPDLCTVYVQQALIIMLAGAIPCISLQFCCGRAMRFLGHDATLADAAQAFALRLIPQYFGVGCMTILQRVYQAHDLVISNMVICGVVCVLAPLIQWAFVHWFDFGVLGAAWAAGAFNCLYVFFQVKCERSQLTPPTIPLTVSDSHFLGC
jgi:Na+-driven multidrug efflux pump